MLKALRLGLVNYDLPLSRLPPPPSRLVARFLVISFMFIISAGGMLSSLDCSYLRLSGTLSKGLG